MRVVQDLLANSPECTSEILTMCQQYVCLETGFEDPAVGVAALRAIVSRFFQRRGAARRSDVGARKSFAGADSIAVGAPAPDVLLMMLAVLDHHPSSPSFGFFTPGPLALGEVCRNGAGAARRLAAGGTGGHRWCWWTWTTRTMRA